MRVRYLTAWLPKTAQRIVYGAQAYRHRTATWNELDSLRRTWNARADATQPWAAELYPIAQSLPIDLAPPPPAPALTGMPLI